MIESLNKVSTNEYNNVYFSMQSINLCLIL